MKIVSTIIFVSLAFVSGCAHTSAPAITTAANVEDQSLPDKCSQHPCRDSFDVAGDAFATGSRYVWNESKRAYEYLTNEESKERARKAWEAVKATAGSAYDKAVENK